MSNRDRKPILQRIKERILPIDSFRTRGKMILSAKIADAMREKGVNHAALLHSLNKGNTPSLVTRWLSGDHNFTIDLLLGIQFVLGVKLINLDIDDLFDEEVALEDVDLMPQNLFSGNITDSSSNLPSSSRGVLISYSTDQKAIATS